LYNDQQALNILTTYSSCQNNVPIQFLMLEVEQQMTPRRSALSESLTLSRPFFSEHIFVICYRYNLLGEATEPNSNVNLHLSGGQVLIIKRLPILFGGITDGAV
ncbi:MAG: hypothetical protein MI862_09295, partial [Desulfobacterales bacterium]|nr:hypothetical protein [Desulfobacterales bacterium]